MKFHKNKLLTIGAAVALTLAVAACSSNGDGDQTTSTTTPTTPTDPGTPAPLTELETAQADAAAAAAAAMTASTDAADAVAAAMTAIANLATSQTDATAADLAGEAQTAADKAKLAYEHAKAASEAAAEAEDVTAAVEARVMAENAMASAVTYGTTATEKAGEAETAAMAELMIVGTVKTVGGTDLDAEAGSTVVTVGEGDDAQTTRTGLLEGMAPMTTGEGADTGVRGVQDDPATDDNEAVKHVQRVADREFAIGKVVDSADDTARLMIVTKYAGSKNAYVYNAGTDTESGTKAGLITIEDTDTTETDENNVRLKSEGTFYAAGAAGGGEGGLAETDEVADDTKGVEVFSYKDVGENDDPKKYVVLTTESTTAGTTTYTYTNVDVEVTVAAAGEEAAFETKVRAAIPEATDYEHIHFGAWAALGAAAKTGSQKLSDLGIGFVQSIGDGLSGADMPNNGSGSYEGNWVATVRAADEDGNGAISLTSGDASLSANFGKGEITATLNDLATLSGEISGNTFSGIKASDITHTSLDADGKFTGSFSGGFYGTKAAEAGGIFDFTSEDAEAGEFRGAFGADRKE